MDDGANPGRHADPAADDRRLVELAGELADGVERVLPAWVVRCVTDTADAWRPGLGLTLVPAAERSGEQAAADVGERVRRLLALDVDAQATGPLAVIRGAVRYPTDVLQAAGVPPVERDDFAVRAFPDDVYGLSPAAFADVAEELHEPGLAWGAAKAYVVVRRHRGTGGPPAR